MGRKGSGVLAMTFNGDFNAVDETLTERYIDITFMNKLRAAESARDRGFLPYAAGSRRADPRLHLLYRRPLLAVVYLLLSFVPGNSRPSLVPVLVRHASVPLASSDWVSVHLLVRSRPEVDSLSESADQSAAAFQAQ